MTSIEWLLSQLEKFHHPTEAMIMYANKMFKQQIIDAYDLGSLSEMQYPNPKTVIENGEQYYNETYRSKGSDDKFDVLKEMFELEQIDITSHKGSSETKPHSFCKTPEEKCTMSYCDENGCINRKKNLVVEPSSPPETLYTKEQVMDAIRLARQINYCNQDYEIIVSLKLK